MESASRYTPTKVLAKQGVTAVAGIAGGVVLLAMGALPSVIGIAVGAIAGVVGIGALLSKNPDDKKAGAVLAAGGALAAASKLPLLAPIAGTLLSLGGIGFLALGVWKGIKFFKGLKSRG